ncbi:MAG: AlpA family phage regulatory protein [Candidatus Aenigmatarchaeota archaeon]
MIKKYLTLKDIIQNYSISRSTVYLWMKTLGFPKPIKVGIRKSLWIASEIEDWFERRK